MVVMLKQPTTRSLGLDEEHGVSLGPLDEVKRSFEVPRVEVAAAALARLWQELGLEPEAPLIFLGSKYHLKRDHHQPRLLDMATARGRRRKRPRLRYRRTSDLGAVAESEPAPRCLRV